MNIVEYHYRDVGDPRWDFSRVKFGKINLLVGDTATGKTRLLNTIFNLGRFVASRRSTHGHWEMVFDHAGTTYTWIFQAEKRERDEEPVVVVEDRIWTHENDILVPLVERDETTFRFGGRLMPKLSPAEPSISLLKEEELIQPLHEAFSIVQRRLFFHDALSKISELHALPVRLVQTIQEQRNLRILFRAQMGLSACLFILSEYFKDTYRQVVDQYRRFFPFVEEARVVDLSRLQPNVAVSADVPVFEVRERGSDRWIPVTELSSGMQKVLLILTDISILPDGGVYIIDEYENSLGINAIDFFPEYVLELEKAVQVFVTSHHPYIINAISPKQWYVFHRDGMEVTIKYGQELEERYGKSKQKAFIQLINDPFFAEGVE